MHWGRIPELEPEVAVVSEGCGCQSGPHISRIYHLHRCLVSLTAFQIVSSTFARNVVLANVALRMDPSVARICRALGSRPIDDVTRSLLRNHTWSRHRRIDRHVFTRRENNAIKALGDRIETLLGIVLEKVDFVAAHSWLTMVLDALILPAHEAVRLSFPALAYRDEVDRRIRE